MAKKRGLTRPIQSPRPRPQQRSNRAIWALAGAAALLVIAALIFGLSRRADDSPSAASAPAAGLPNTPDYHSLLVDADDPNGLFLGTHQGLYRSTDGGVTWRFATLSGNDAMNLARPGGKTIWTAGHEVLAKSTDAGQSWTQVRPPSLPSYDIHGFAIDPRHPNRLYAAVAGEGLYRSDDGGGSFKEVSRDVGGGVFALAVDRSGHIFAGDAQQGLLVSSDGGRSWRVSLRAGVGGIAINPKDPRRLLAAGARVDLSSDGGKSWRPVLTVQQGAGPVAWAPSDPRVAYVVGFDRTLYVSRDRGAHWQPVSSTAQG